MSEQSKDGNDGLLPVAHELTVEIVVSNVLIIESGMAGFKSFICDVRGASSHNYLIPSRITL